MVVSVDIDRDAIKYGRMIYGVECVRADAAHLPFRKNAFDSVISLETLEHVRDQGLFLGALGTALKRRES
jgi:2-polyprenyl-3-methyl-5-hydroxy-6-metoxy-1,4-benzoquinol methylase